MNQNIQMQAGMNGHPMERMVIPQIVSQPFQAREAINVLRGNIQMSGFDLRVIAITSALAKEGKSSVAFRLAKSFASLNKRTLYLDCDIRNSTTLSRYKIQQRTLGLSEFLCGRIGLPDVIYRTDDRWMDMIFAGTTSPNPSELISGPLFSQLIAYARERYEYVIVDTPPINPVIDGTLIAKHCDGAILVVESGVTERIQAIRAKRQLEYADVKVLGAVLNKVGTKKSRYGYGYGYGYGETRSKGKRKE